MEPSNADVAMDAIRERIKQRSENVALAAEQRRAKQDTNASSAESINFFYDNFATMKEIAEKNISLAKTTEPENLSQYFDSLLEEIQSLQQFLNESSLFLPSYQIKKAQESIDNLNQSLELCNQEMNPKKKFGFRAKKPAEDKKKTGGADAPDSLSDNLETRAVLDDILRQNFFGFRDLEDCELMKTESELQDRQFALHNLKNCNVIALGNPSSLQISNLHGCTVIMGPTSRSAFVKDCHNCKFVIACQQVRVHNTEDTQFYLHVTGAAIIENCKALLFAPYNLSYPDLGSHYVLSHLDTKINYWDKVEDFHWLNENEKSPNFSLMLSKDMQSSWL